MFPRLLLIALGTLVVFLVASVVKSGMPFRTDSAPVHMAAFSKHGESRTALKEIVLDEKFKVAPGDRLEIGVVHSDVDVRAGSASEVGVRIEISGNRARAFFEHLNFAVEKRGDTVFITTSPRGSWNRGGGDVDVFVTLPETFDADVDVAHGDLNVERMNGALSYSIAHGDFSAGSLAGSSLHVQAAHGDVDVGAVMSGKVQIRSAHGDVDVRTLTTAEFVANVQHGDVHVERAEGYARVSAAHGDIAIGFLKLNGGSFSNSHGDIELAAPAGIAVDVDFAGEDVEIAAIHRFEGTLKEKRAQGRVNGGGPMLEVKTSHGDVSLREL